MLVFNSFGNKQISNKIREQCKRFKIRLTRKVNGKRIYKTIKQLKTQLATAKNNRNKFGAKNASASKPRIESATKTVTNYGSGCHVTQGGNYGKLHSTCPNGVYSRVAHYTAEGESEDEGVFWTTNPKYADIPLETRNYLVEIYNHHINIANEKENRYPGYRGRGPPSSGVKRRIVFQ
jgi:hypothetical protein